MVNETIEQLLKNGLEILEERDYNNPFLDVQLILAYLLKKDRVYLHVHKDKKVNEIISNKYYELIRIRNTGYPLQYIINNQEFMGLDFYVQEGILIPRPDTEVLVEKIIKLVKCNFINNHNINILDIGTGSGAIALSLAYYIKNSQVIAIDLSDIAIETAKINAKKHNLKNIKIIKGDLFNDLNTGKEKFNIIVSNPPYIEKGEIEKLQKEVANYEPRLALDGGDDGLKFYRQIIKTFKTYSEDNSILAVEIGYNQGDSVRDIFELSKLFNEIMIEKDLAGHDRVVIGYKGCFC